jgi:transcriptional regulator with XRE-family HTH domain
MKHRELASRLGVSRARVSQLASGEGNPTLRVLARIASALDHELFIELKPTEPSRRGKEGKDPHA